MGFYPNDTKQNIENIYGEMTQIEQYIADFFIRNHEMIDFSSKNISKLLHVSEASLSRFAKKCAFKGYRELIYSYENDLKYEYKSNSQEVDISSLTKKVQNTYLNLMKESFDMLDENQIRNIAALLNSSNRVFVYGMGSSGFVAKEFQLRFMRLGLDVEAITDSQMIRMSAALAKNENLIIAISLSGRTKEIMDSILIAKAHNARVILITSNPDTVEGKLCDEVLLVASRKNLDTGTKISPQFSILIMVDVLYSYYFANDSYFNTQTYNETLAALYGKKKTDD